MLSGVEARHFYNCCPLCDSPDFVLIRETDCSSHPLYNPELPGKMRWMLCNECGHNFTDGYYSEEALDILFSKAHDYQLLDVGKMEQSRAVSADIVDKVSSVLKKQEGKWLDVGFGNGSLLITCQEYGFQPIGIDLRADAVTKMESLGIDAYCIQFNDFKQNNDFTVISMADVLEHMPYPKKTLEKACKLLVPGGVLFVSCPNADSLVWKVFTKTNANPYWGEMEHYHNFGRERFYSLLVEHGFNPVNYSISKRYRIGMEVISIKDVTLPNYSVKF